jgi:hypothetical protein
MPRMTKKRTILGSLVAMAVIAAAAFAYFSSTGSGTGSASVGSSAAITIHGDASTTLFPGTSSSVPLTIDNPGPGHEYVGTIHLSSVDTGVVGCNAAWFTMPDVTVNTDYAQGNGQSAGTGTLSMTNTASNQDLCQNASLTLNFTSN